MENKATTNHQDKRHQAGVGGRHTETPPPGVQGGYLYNCNQLKAPISSAAAETRATDKTVDNVYTARPDLLQTDLFWNDIGPRILVDHQVPQYSHRQAPEIPLQFTSANLAPFWQRIAAHLGPIAFLELLSTMWDYAPEDGDRQRIDIPSRESMRKLWRNGLIRQAAALGLDSAQTVKSLKKSGFDVSETTVGRVLRYLPLDD